MDLLHGNHIHVVLDVHEGYGFDFLNSNSVYLLCHFNSHPLRSHYVNAHPKPVFNCNFMWLTSPHEIDSMLTKSCIIEIWSKGLLSDDYMIAYAVLPVSTAQILPHNANDELQFERLKFNWVRKHKSKKPIELQVCVSIQDKLRDINKMSCYDDEVVKKSCLLEEITPTYQQAEGLIQIGEISDSRDTFEFFVTILNIKKLNLLTKTTSSQKDYHFLYDLFGFICNSGKFKIKCTKSTLDIGETCKIRVRSNLDNLKKYFNFVQGFMVTLFKQKCEIGSTFIDMTSFLEIESMIDLDIIHNNTLTTDMELPLLCSTDDTETPENSSMLTVRVSMQCILPALDFPEFSSCPSSTYTSAKPSSYEDGTTGSTSASDEIYSTANSDDPQNSQSNVPKPRNKNDTRHYVLEVTIKYLKWFKKRNNSKIQIRIFDPKSCTIITLTSGAEFYLFDLAEAKNILCQMFYVVNTNDMIDILKNFQPQMLFCEAGTDKLLYQSIIDTRQFEGQQQIEFKTMVLPVVDKNGDSMGEVFVSVVLKDSGIILTRKKGKKLDQPLKLFNVWGHWGMDSPVVTNAEQEGEEFRTDRVATEQDIYKKIKKFERLLEEAKRERAILQSKLDESDRGKRPDGILKNSQRSNDSGKENTDRSKVPSDQNIQSPRKKVTFNIEKEKSTSEIGVQTEKKRGVTTMRIQPRNMSYIPDPPVKAIKRRCRDCNRLLEVWLGTQVWEDSNLVFTCKDCRIDRLKKEIKLKMKESQNCASKLQNEIQRMGLEFEKYKKETISVEKSEKLLQERHVLVSRHNMAQMEINIFREKWAKAVEELNQLKSHPNDITVAYALDVLTRDGEERTKDKHTLDKIHKKVDKLQSKLAQQQKAASGEPAISESSKKQPESDKSNNEDSDETASQVAIILRKVKIDLEYIMGERDICIRAGCTKGDKIIQLLDQEYDKLFHKYCDYKQKSKTVKLPVL